MPKGIYKRIIGINCGLPTQGYQKGHPCYSKNFYKGMKSTYGFLGKSHTKEANEKNRQAHLGKHYSPKTEFKKGQKFSKEIKEKIRQGLIGNKWNIGKKRSEKFKKHLSEINKGEKSYLWRGGISFNPYSVDWTRTLKRSIRERDRYTCQICRKEPAFDIHHIDYNKENCNPKNLVTLCRGCHIKTNHNRNQWINYFKRSINLIS